VGVTIAIGVILGFLLLLGLSTGGATREGSYRRGQGWYLDTETPRDTLMGGRFAIPSRRRVSAWLIRLWTGAGIAFLVIALVTWLVVHSVGVAVLCGVVGLLTIALAWDGGRQNRRLENAKAGAEEDA
jgi:peptidoglycan/LPS O-acetylase OafA/YrhL